MDTDVVVVGAGPTGLTAAGELARRGWRVRVLDASAAPFPGSRGKGMQPRSLEVLDPLCVADRLVSLGRFELPIRQHAADGTVREAGLHAGAVPQPDRPWVRPLIIPQWRTEQVLRERLTELGVVVEQDMEVVDVAQDGDGVTLTLADGRAVRAGWVVGADGGSSVMRRRLGVSFLGETHEEIRMLLADVEVEGLERDYWHMWGDIPDGTLVALCPLPASETWALQMAQADPGARPDLETLRAAVEGLSPRLRVHRIAWSSTWRLNVRMVDRYRVGRVFLAGDAAHVHSPAGGLGMNTGIQDAVNLGWKLAAVLGGADEVLLDTYEAERLPVAADVLGLSSRLIGYAFWQRGTLTRDTLQLDITYRGGPLAHDDTPDAPGPRPGDRAPDAPLRLADGTPTTLFLLRRDAEWTALAFGSSAPEVPSDVTGEVTVLDADDLDVDGHLRRAYHPVDGELILLRPDGHVALRTRERSSVLWHGQSLTRRQPKGTASAGQAAPSAGSVVGSSR